ncbi:MAG: polyphosphate kinase 1, partial [Planctomycetota bacterium]
MTLREIHADGENDVPDQKTGDKKAIAKRKTGGKRGELPPDRYLNRELSWLAFNERVLAQASDESLPILERAKFLAITSGNLDEFMMVRVGGLKILHERDPDRKDPAGLTAAQQLAAVSQKGHEIVAKQYQLYRDRVCPQLASAGLVEVQLSDARDVDRDSLEKRFRESVFPVLSPQAVTRERFPLLKGLGLHLCVRLVVDSETRLGQRSSGQDNGEEYEFAVIPLGRSLPRVLPVPVVSGAGYKRHAYIRLESLAGHFIEEFFPGREIAECIAFRITRNADIELREDEAGDLMGGMEEVLETRRFSRPVKLEYSSTASETTIEFLRHSLKLDAEDLYAIDGPVDLRFLFSLHGEEGFDQLRDEPWPARPHPRIDSDESMFETIAVGDLMLVHPYDRFDSVVRLIEEAAVDPAVMAIKQVLYRTSKNSPVVAALERAAKHGKYVTAIVELKARFDEARNIEWAREMERAGVQVIYGIHGLKTHAKICIIVRREPQGIVRYMHFGTGN